MPQAVEKQLCFLNLEISFASLCVCSPSLRPQCRTLKMILLPALILEPVRSGLETEKSRELI
jgi:hypothetical protein